MMAEENKKFKIGLCMAGAISAGAYTAGVIDYLIEALEEWQKRKDNNTPNTPSHNVEIPIIGGASAGGMTGIIASSAIQDKIEPVRELGDNIMDQIPNNMFYHSWVDLISDDMIRELLKTNDISKNEVHSALNAQFLDKVASRIVQTNNEPQVIRKYFSNNLKLFVTLSNLEGMEYSVNFRSQSTKLNQYRITNHGDFACFKLCKSETEYSNDGWIPLNFKSKLNTDLVRDSALSTGAFPVGLKARELSREKKHMNQHEWFKHITETAQNPFKEDPYNTVNIDGGMINNEPFEKVRELLNEEFSKKEVEEIDDFNKFKSTVLMVDPFPSEPGKFNPSTKLTSIIGSSLNALLNQARIKPPTLIDALDSKKAGQHLISPVRYEKKDGLDNSIEGKKAIACGSLDGFGGFISKEFRIHDYFLGRANCEKFLRDYFTVPINNTNDIFVNGYSNINDKTQFISKKNGGLQIIPIFSTERNKPYMPKFSNNKEWPSVSKYFIKSYKKIMKSRVQKILLNISDFGKKERVLLWIGAKVLINGKITDSVINKVIDSLKAHQLLK
ncbi:MAG: putative acylesterase/phospholipase RssA [Polaribacter sp.]|jgi:predicted acylesterase/phospholipase RssA